MPWIRFTKDHNWVQPAFTIAYKAGMHLNVTRACADEAVAAGKAVRAKRPIDGKEAE
ncbi:hypothetical protein GB928_004225 [Shinella curvata]|uniref:Uncharacterized protein n=1 Tax=Shinella curvata TaxID=1817964 RepID=A0ABT8X9G3_9HYPH|nr:hypothetical protein [Shinella curvata]MCJ8051670.1 hypothetical protein [Shinella curvata]MDO6120382.1 hypothetical protein [Shinella curvata]